MLPEKSAIIVADAVPALFEGDEAGVEGVALGTPDDFPRVAVVKGTDQMNGMRGRQGLHVRHDGRPAHLAQRRQPSVVELPAALAQQHAEQREESAPVADAEQLQDVARVEAVHPLAEERRLLARGEQRLGQPTVQQATIEVGSPEPVDAFVPQHGAQMHRLLPPRERVPELSRRGKRGGSGRQHAESRIGVGGYLQKAAGIGQAVHLVQNEHRTGRLTVEEQLGIGEHPFHGGQIAVQMERIGQHAGECRLADAPDTGEPDDRTAGPRAEDAIQPRLSAHHVVFYIQLDWI